MINSWSPKTRAWSVVFLWVFCIYSTLYVTERIIQHIKHVVPLELSTTVLTLLVLCVIIIAVWRKIRLKTPLTYFLLLCSVTMYVYGLTKLQAPAEKIHFIQYGVLAYFILTACRFDFKTGWSYLIAFVLTSLFGWGDEGIQYILPNRYYELNDVILNSVSGALGLFFTFIIQRQ